MTRSPDLPSPSVPVGGETSGAVPGFLPSVHGLPFANAFPPGPTLRLGPLDPRLVGLGDASAGLCGGMALTARDLYEVGLTAPDGAGPPANGSPRFRALVRRQIQSLDWLRVPLRYFDLQAMRPDPPSGLAAALHREPPRVPTILDELPRVRAEIDDGHPSVVGLIRATGCSPWLLTRNHQVLAFAYAADDRSVVLRVYDPNHPRRDDVELRASISEDRGVPWRDRIGLTQSTGEPLLGFFRQPYPEPGGLRAWRRP
ncbi:MAG: hypothetical protein MUQ32_04080 [Chloroflexi bacterium]|nr:hypothetical protein [Chloroflexota bacterium]